MTSKLTGADKLKVLLVDDNLMTKTFTESMLQSFGFQELQYSSNALDAWDKLEKHKNENVPFDIMLLDWNMPGMSGYDLLRRCREDATLNNLAIIMVTAENQKRNVLEAIKAGATSYVTKPVAADDMLFKLSQVVDWKKNQSKVV